MDIQAPFYMEKLNAEEILNFLIQSDTINLSYVQDKIEMSKKEQILKQHKWAISQGKDGYWRTYLPDDEKGRKMVKKRTQREVEMQVIKFYESRVEKPKTFDDCYWLWRSFQNEMVSENTIAKYDTDYRRYFQETEFSETELIKITEEMIKVFIVKTVKNKQLCKKACKTLFGYIKNTLYTARSHKIISDNPMEFLQAKNFYKYCTEVKKTSTQRIVSEKDMKLLYDKFYEDYKKQPNYIPTYAVHFATLTGMRVGEISALRWDSITDDYIVIDKSEKYNRNTKQYFIDKTKNGKDRIFPLTAELKILLKNLKKIEMSYGFLSEWVFSNENGRIHAPIISSCSKNKCRQVGIDEKGIHAYRRTINSKMRCDGVSAVVASSLLGHSPEVNDTYYTFDVSSFDEKKEIISSITKQMPIAK